MDADPTRLSGIRPEGIRSVARKTYLFTYLRGWKV